MQKILTIMSALAVCLTLTGCYDGGKKHCTSATHGEYTRTHKYDDVTKLRASMRQTYGDKHELGSIKFTEESSGLAIQAEMTNVRPNTEYSLAVFAMKNCNKETKKCDLERKNVNLPKFTSDANGKIKETFIETGISAAELDKLKIEMIRDGAPVAAGVTNERWLF